MSHQITTNTITSTCNTGMVEVDYFIEGSTNIICSKVFNFDESAGLTVRFPAAEITVGCEDTDFGDVVISGGNCNNAIPSENLREFDVPAGLGYCKKILREITVIDWCNYCLLYTSPSPRDATLSRMPSSA